MTRGRRGRARRRRAERARVGRRGDGRRLLRARRAVLRKGASKGDSDERGHGAEQNSDLSVRRQKGDA